MGVTEHGVLFTAQNIIAIGTRRKTKTRRVITARNSTVLGYGVSDKSPLWASLDWDDVVNNGSQLSVAAIVEGERLRYRVRPRWSRGDFLYVREAATYRGNPDLWDPADSRPIVEVEYRADGAVRQIELPDGAAYKAGRRPGIHMWKWAARLWLRVTDVRVERVQDISEDDARAEGYPYFDFATNMPVLTDFTSLWDSINAKRGHGWDTNPWVWVITFELAEGPHA